MTVGEVIAGMHSATVRSLWYARSYLAEEFLQGGSDVAMNFRRFFLLIQIHQPFSFDPQSVSKTLTLHGPVASVSDKPLCH